ncbi:MAG: two-component sensor histidine kinase [Planctomycetes bacterium]|jgi:signal transduction histidine kinase|nr:two-component sensor histidine kinase [Planctomycetota bacterium]MBT4029694.1 two-component sensor histidine kinase [Planctomycetota bacterium]MBT4561194.1 two-component sensor histidine kinase [Planctomycetota bacterium]MBT5100660.1 two-component sensor histidine kinase [Planctomycetota bacterium]MBT7012075.1 two-component sensor histidine kinase [Planctomycetota bacterium]
MVPESRKAPPLDPEALASLAGGLAHELKNPLSTLSLQLSLLEGAWQDDTPLAARSRKRLASLRTEVNRLDTILRDFLRFARTDSMALEPARLNSLVEEVLQFARPECEQEGIQLDSFLAAGSDALQLDPARFRQALLNIIINARQAFEGKGGAISVFTRFDDSFAYVEVVDNGSGMSPETLARVQEAYFSTKTGGSGLGLPTVKRVLEAHGGHLSLDSSPEHGTRVMLTFPR